MGSDTPAVPRGLIGWFVTNRVAANLLMFAVLASGAIALSRMKVEVFQEVDPDLIRVEVPYPGASPSEVEEGICLRVEEAIKGIKGIKRLRAEASETRYSMISRPPSAESKIFLPAMRKSRWSWMWTPTSK